MKRTDIINELISIYNYESYVEIGVRNPEDNFNKIKCKNKIGVDPDFRAKPTHLMTSDQFFEDNNHKFDLIFIDGLHTHYQSSLDLYNSLQSINKNGTIVLHDCNPETEEMQFVPPVQKKWTGDVWKSFVEYRTFKKDLNMFVINCDFGVGIVRFGSQDLVKISPTKLLTYRDLEKNRQIWLNLVSPENWKSKL